MRAVVITSPGGPEVLELRAVADPVPARGEVRVRVRATAVNRADLLQRMGLYPPPPGAPQDIPGLELAGEIDATGEGVTELHEGDRVFGLAAGGTYAERVVLHARTVARMPSSLDFVRAAAVPEAFLTAYDAMVLQAGLVAGESVLVSAVGSGVGTAAIQIARAIGARPFGTARTEQKLEKARTLGMIDGVVPDQGRFADAIAKLTGGGPNVVLELAGGRYVAEDVTAARPRGRIVVVGLMAGARAEVDLATMLRKRLTLKGTVLRARPLEEKIAAARVLEDNLAPLFEEGKLRPVVDRVFSLSHVRQAHELVANNETFGKVVLEV